MLNDVTTFLITCCHATCAIPEAQREFFKGHEDTINSTKGWEPGALNFAQGLAMKLQSTIVHGDVTRLLINVECQGPQQWSEYSLKLPEHTRERVKVLYLDKFLTSLDHNIEQLSKLNETIYIVDIHTAPLLSGEVTLEHIGHASAQTLCKSIESHFKIPEATLKIKKLDPTSPLIEHILSKKQGANIGIIRVTISQSFFLESKPIRWETLKKGLLSSFANASPT